MIRLTRLRHSDPLYLNPDHIERLDRAHDTVVHLLNGNEYVVVESPEEIVDQITQYRARAIATAARMAVEHLPESAALAPIQVVAAVTPLPEIEEES
jgi:flagellar protein FlbD